MDARTAFYFLGINWMMDTRRLLYEASVYLDVVRALISCSVSLNPQIARLRLRVSILWNIRKTPALWVFFFESQPNFHFRMAAGYSRPWLVFLKKEEEGGLWQCRKVWSTGLGFSRACWILTEMLQDVAGETERSLDSSSSIFYSFRKLWNCNLKNLKHHKCTILTSWSPYTLIQQQTLILSVGLSQGLHSHITGEASCKWNVLTTEENLVVNGDVVNLSMNVFNGQI